MEDNESLFCCKLLTLLFTVRLIFLRAFLHNEYYDIDNNHDNIDENDKDEYDNDYDNEHVNNVNNYIKQVLH